MCGGRGELLEYNDGACCGLSQCLMCDGKGRVPPTRINHQEIANLDRAEDSIFFLAVHGFLTQAEIRRARRRTYKARMKLVDSPTPGESRE